MADFNSPPHVSADEVDQNRKQSLLVLAWRRQLWTLLSKGVTGTVPLAKLTGAGVNGSLTFVNGVLTAKVDPT